MVFDFSLTENSAFVPLDHDTHPMLVTQNTRCTLGDACGAHHTSFVLKALKKKFKRPWANEQYGLEALGAAKVATAKAAKMASVWMDVAQHQKNAGQICKEMWHFMKDYMMNPKPKHGEQAGASLATASASACEVALGMNLKYLNVATSAMLRSVTDMVQANGALRRYIRGSNWVTFSDVNPRAGRYASKGHPVVHSVYAYPMGQACKKETPFLSKYSAEKPGEDLPNVPPLTLEGLINENAAQLNNLQFF